MLIAQQYKPRLVLSFPHQEDLHVLTVHCIDWHLPSRHDVEAVLFGQIGNLPTPALRPIIPLAFELRVSALLDLLG